MVHETLIQTEKFNQNKFYMWRCITAMAHADGIVHEDEKTYLEKIFSNMLNKDGIIIFHDINLRNSGSKKYWQEIKKKFKKNKVKEIIFERYNFSFGYGIIQP